MIKPVEAEAKKNPTQLAELDFKFSISLIMQ